ncbi:nucleoside-diphosphate kinase [Nitratireductor mangrovi]|uniref:Nucleoside-diphosphate kinase n=1 Tax=Nitratireductor mangrovi TaxID=2599600 RepID=A0A5B8KXC2_9HYPH|nr:nucleoside-diphosphate kinase [Nitratireductor mangrovi]QDZ00219.1 nucleoside-diphosphate kinase [Nitratireductor mangrovi]
MTKETCFLTTKDFTILEVMRDRCLGRDDPLARILKRKIASATVMFRDDIPVNVATLSSRVTFSVNGRDPDTRIVSHDRMTSPIGMFLPITTARGLALLGLSEGQDFAIRNGDGEEERVLLHEVHYQPEAARREKEALEGTGSETSGKPTLRVIRGAFHDQHRLVPLAHDGFDDPGPSAA